MFYIKCSLILVHQETVVSKLERNETKEKASEDTDEIDIWALRAQALKSLACKRAAKAKQTNKVQMHCVQ